MCLAHPGFVLAQNTATPKLPIVAKPPPAKPAVGLAEDSRLDVTTPRATTGRDLVMVGWT